MTPKTPSTITDTEGTHCPGSGAPAEVAARWTEARLAYPLYAALATQFELAQAPYPAGELPPARPTRDVFDRDLQWFDAIDEKVRAFQIRQLPPEVLNASEEALRAFIQRLLKRPGKTNADRDKIDLLLVQYFALCAPEALYRDEIKLADVARVLQPVRAEVTVVHLTHLGREPRRRVDAVRDVANRDAVVRHARIEPRPHRPRYLAVQ